MIILYIPIVYIGCTSPGSYGKDCSTPCPQNCQDKRCHIVEGTCLECVDRYNGSICSKGYCQDKLIAILIMIMLNETQYTLLL